MSAGSLHSGPNNSIPTGTPTGADSVGLEKPPGNVIGGTRCCSRALHYVQLFLADPRNETPLMWIENGVELLAAMTFMTLA